MEDCQKILINLLENKNLKLRKDYINSKINSFLNNSDNTIALKESIIINILEHFKNDITTKYNAFIIYKMIITEKKYIMTDETLKKIIPIIIKDVKTLSKNKKILELYLASFKSISKFFDKIKLQKCTIISF